MTDPHATPAREEPLTPADTAAPSHAERARTLLSLERTGTLSTLDPDGFPHGAYVTFALEGGDPVFLISKLATHTQNLLRDPRASLMAHETRADDLGSRSSSRDPLANGRVTLVGPCTKVADPTSARAAFLSAHPSAAYYADFADFGLYRLDVKSVRYIGGYGRMSWIDAADFRAAAPDPLARDAEGILRHMNDDHREALVLYARAFTRATWAEDVTMTAIDRRGFELSVATPSGPRPARLAFATEITTPLAARQALVALVKDARAKLAP
jgi:putative heme iron utilization protein